MYFNYPIYHINLVNKRVSNATLHVYDSPLVPNVNDVILIKDDSYFVVKQRIVSGEPFNLNIVLDGYIIKE